MALSAQHRSILYTEFVERLGPEVTEAFLAEFPSRDLDVPATKEFVHAEIAGVRAEIADTRADLRAEIADTRADLQAEIAGVRLETAALRAQFHEDTKRMLVVLVSVVCGMGTLLLAAMAIAVSVLSAQIG